MRLTGIVVVLTALLVPLIWFVPLAAKHDPVAIFSEYLGATALIAMAFSQLLATRFKLLQTVFGGLDRIYVLHKWLGIGAIVAVLLHDTVDADVAGLGRETALSDLAETFGEIGLYGLLILTVITIVTFIPYNLWRWTHKFMGALFALAVLHFAFIMKPFATLDPLGLYILSFGIIGIASYVIALLPHGWRHGGNLYRVTHVEPSGDALAITLLPERNKLRYREGQFTFVQFKIPGHEEVHPFSISKGSDESGALRFTIKRLGDYTGELQHVVAKGVKAVVSGPYGHFNRKTGVATEIWIAGGIGITPFVAWAQALEDGHAPVHLFHCVRERATAPHLAELQALALSRVDFHFHLVESSKGHRLTADRIVQAVDGPIASTRAYFCGPKSMREQIGRGLRRNGLRSSAFYFEEFEIRSGIGLRRMVSWLLALFPRRSVAGTRLLRRPRADSAF
jgi:predicted ferric reductase